MNIRSLLWGGLSIAMLSIGVSQAQELPKSKSALLPTGKWTAYSSGNSATPPMGWNSWNAFRTEVNEDKVIGAAQKIVSSGLAKKGYKYINIDDGWWLKRNMENNRLLIRTSIFPGAKIADGDGSSFKPFVKKIHDMGLKAGIYTDVGKNACSQVWDLHSPNLPEGSTSEREVGLWGHVQEDITLFFEDWGFDYLKVDACGLADYSREKPFIKEYNYNPFEPLIVRGDLIATDEHKVELLYDQVNDALEAANPDKDFVLSICTWGTANVRAWGKNQGNLWRTSEDIRNTWDSMLHVFDSAAARTLYAGPGTWNDPDMLFIGHGDFDENHLTEAKSHFALWSIISAPLLIGYDLRQAPQALLDIWGAENMIAINQDPAGNQAAVVYDNNDTQILVKSLHNLNQKAVALFNRSNTPQKVTLYAEQLNFDKNASIQLKDLWTNKTSRFKGSKTFTIKPHETLIYKASGVRELKQGVYLTEIPGRINVAVDGLEFIELTPQQHRKLAQDFIKSAPGSEYRNEYPGFAGASVGQTPYASPITLAGRVYPDGLGLLANSRLEIKTNSEFSEFSALVGVNSETPNKEAQVIFSVYGDGKKLTSSKPLMPGDDPVQLRVKVSGVKILELVAEQIKGENSKLPSLVNWANPVLQ